VYYLARLRPELVRLAAAVAPEDADQGPAGHAADPPTRPSKKPRV
jgi:hypothetical protein